ncbi:MAG TPA: hypothetical protein DC054_01685 [Blastocatellia bacterium]|nr:hypothetical protein [Blastocatellia bacterium]
MPNKRSILVFPALGLSLSLTYVVALAQTRPSPEAAKKAEVLLKQGVIKTESGDHKAAIDAFTQAIQLNKGYAEAYYQRGLVLARVPWHEVELPSTDLKDFEQALRPDPGLVDADIQLGVKKQEISYFDRAIAINPNLAEAYYHRGRIRSRYPIDYLEEFHKEGTLPKPDSFLSEVLKVPAGSNTEQAFAYVSRILQLTIRDYAQAISLKPQYVDSYFARGLRTWRWQRASWPSAISPLSFS